MYFREILEGTTDVLYHFRNIFTAVDILRDNRFTLHPIMKNSSEEEHGIYKSYFLSTTRSKEGDYHQRETSGVVFVLDGRKLGYKYKSKPIEYWGTQKPEMEDRIFSDEPYIPAIPYIVEMHVIFKDVPSKGEFYLDKLAKDKDIPIYFYDDQKQWLLQNKRKAVDIDPPSDPEEFNTKRSYVRRSDNPPDEFAVVTKLVNGVDEKNLDMTSLSLVRLLARIQDVGSFRKDPQLADFVNTLAIEITYFTARDKPEHVRKIGHDFLRNLRKNGIRTMPQLLQKIKNNYSPKPKKMTFDDLDITQEYIDDIYYIFSGIYYDFIDNGIKQEYLAGYHNEKIIVVNISSKEFGEYDHLITLDKESFVKVFPVLPLIFNTKAYSDLQSDGGTKEELSEILRDNLDEIVDILKVQLENQW